MTTPIALSFDDNGANGSPFVFVHGWCCNRSFFEPQATHFGASHRVIAVDLRGHGQSDAAADGDYSVEAFAGDIAALLGSLGLGPAVVVGHSLGGVITTALAASHPDLVAAAVLVDPAPLVIGDAMRPGLTALLDAINGPDGVATRAALVQGMFMATDTVRKDEIISTMAARPHEIAAPAISGLLDFDGTAALASVTRPICVISSDGPANDGPQMKMTNPSVLLGQTLGVGHFNQLEAPDQVNAMIERFLLINNVA